MVTSTAAGASPPSPNPTSAVTVLTGADSPDADFIAKNPSQTGYLWYTVDDVVSNFFVKSPLKDGSAPKLDSSGELGFLHTGIPWETIRFYVTGAETPAKARDREFLAYVQSGTFTGGDKTPPNTDYGTVPTHVGQTDPVDAVPLIGGPLNVNTNKRPTLQALFMGASSTLDSDATSKAKSGGDQDASDIADALGTNATAAPFALPGDFLALPVIKGITNTQATDFKRETVARRTANMLATQSTRFTVYALGEARDKAGGATVTTSSVNLRAEVELQTDSTGKPMPRVLSATYYLIN
jgi:hypothetical protein